jgi:plastocyanin
MKSLMKNSVKYLAVIMILTTVSVFNGCKDDDDDTPAPTTKEVLMENTKFSPASLTVSVNTTVKWTNKDGFDHNVVSDNSLFDSGLIPAGKTYSRQFTTTGTFPYTCTLHSGMTGSIIVQ